MTHFNVKQLIAVYGERNRPVFGELVLSFGFYWGLSRGAFRCFCDLAAHTNLISMRPSSAQMW